MKKHFRETDPRDLPVNMMLSLPAARKKHTQQYDPVLQEEQRRSSPLHQNNRFTVFEGFYKSITRKLD